MTLSYCCPPLRQLKRPLNSLKTVVHAHIRSVLKTRDRASRRPEEYAPGCRVHHRKVHIIII